MRPLAVLLCAFMCGAAFGAEAESCRASADAVYGGLSLLPCRYAEMPSSDSDVCIVRLNLLAGSHRSVCGLDLGTVCNYVDNDCIGVQLAAANWTDECHYGLQLGGLNTTWGIRGVQLGVFNATASGQGLQIGVCNVAESFCGLQIGLANTIMDSPVRILPIVNAHF